MAKQPEGLGRYGCEACGADFFSQEDLDRHVETAHEMAEADER